MKGFVSPQGTINLIENSSDKVKLSFVDFFTTRLDEKFTNGVIQVLEHDFMYRPGFQKNFDVLPHEELNDIVRKEFPNEKLTPFSAPKLKSFLDIDYLIFIDERLEDKTWFWNIRIYSARSGVFVTDAKVEYRDYHLRWTLDDLIKTIKNIVNPDNSSELSSKATSEILLAESVRKFSDIKQDCEKANCLQNLDDFEWIQKYNPDFLESINRNDFYLNILYKEAKNPIDFARISFLANNPLQGSLKLELQLDKIRYSKKRMQALRLISRSAVETNRQSKAKESSDMLISMSRYDETALFTRAWGFKQNKELPEAINILETILKRNPKNRKAAELLINCYSIRGNKEDEDNIRATKQIISQELYNMGNMVESSLIFIELLDHNFNMKTLSKIAIPLLSANDRKSLATMLNQQALSMGVNEAEIYYQMAKLKLLEKEYVEANTVISGALQQFPKNKKLIELTIWDELTRKKGAIHAQRLLERLPSYNQHPFLKANILEKLGKYKQAENIWAKTIWPKGWFFESLIKQANLQFKQKNYKQALKSIEKAEKIYNSREELVKLKTDALKILQKNKLAEESQIEVWQLSGKTIKVHNLKDHLFFTSYKQLIAPHPIASFNGKKLKLPEKTIILNATVPEKKDSLYFLKSYIPKEKNRLINELKTVLLERYNLVDNSEQEAIFRKHLDVEDPGYKARYNKSDLLELMGKLGTNSAFLVNYLETPILSESMLKVEVKLYYFDGISNSIYLTSAERTVPFFEVYKFNIYIAAIPAALFLILLVAFFHFSRMTKPLSFAQHLINNKSYAKAAQVLERFGYQQDHRRIIAHIFASKRNYLKAYENFVLGKDFDNAVIALKGCPDSGEINNTAAEMFLQLKEYDKAAHFYKRNKNLLGLAKVRSAQGHKQNAAKIMGQYYFENNNPMAAIEEFRKIGEYERAGLVLFYHRKYQEAAVMFRQSSNKEMYRKSLMRAGEKAAAKKNV